MQDVMAMQAEAIREKRARIIKAEAEMEASEKLALAAAKMMENPAALELRRFQMIAEVGAENNSTTVLMIPSDLVRWQHLRLSAHSRYRVGCIKSLKIYEMSDERALMTGAAISNLDLNADCCSVMRRAGRNPPIRGNSARGRDQHAAQSGGRFVATPSRQLILTARSMRPNGDGREFAISSARFGNQHP